MIGGIDPLIAQEYKETQDRYDFLLRESEDLENAMISLEKIIVEMNERIEKDFKKAFIKINQEFGKYFTLMFDGGTASLEKMRLESRGISQEIEDEDEENDFQWGVDIKIQPPKKRVNRLSMLSGGERSLVSLALLFAIIAHNPPPFVVLDEVEAALDEVNSRRFSSLLQTLSSKTQFIVITHNRETMRQADVLYGVTMDDGASKLLSVRLDQIKKGGIIQS
jgi:chromosome segregation protein